MTQYAPQVSILFGRMSLKKVLAWWQDLSCDMAYSVSGLNYTLTERNVTTISLLEIVLGRGEQSELPSAETIGRNLEEKLKRDRVLNSNDIRIIKMKGIVRLMEHTEIKGYSASSGKM